MLPCILDGKKSLEINGDKLRPGISISNSEVGITSLSIAAFLLRLVCTNGMVSKTEISQSYRHLSTKILDDFPQVMDKVSCELATQKHKTGLSMKSPVEQPLKTIEVYFLRNYGPVIPPTFSDLKLIHSEYGVFISFQKQNLRDSQL
jgi:hypothetical protein